MDISRAQTLNSPVFVVGPLRSGTTLLRLLLDHHPEINMFGEFEGAVCQANGMQWPDILNYHKFVENDREMQGLNVTIDKSLDYESLVKCFLEQLFLRKERKIVGASVHSRMDMLPKIWPEAKFIHLLRDPRDVAKSCIGMGWVGNVYEGALYWLKAEEHWNFLDSMLHESQKITIRYEDLVTEPESELTRICEFVGLSYTEEMLKIEVDTTYSRPSAKYANQWKRKLTNQQISWVESRCHKLMRDRGYEITNDPPKRPSQLCLLKIKVQNRTYRMRFNIKRWGLKLWLLHVFSKRFGPESLENKSQG